jgi:hypothetical protein
MNALVLHMLPETSAPQPHANRMRRELGLRPDQKVLLQAFKAVVEDGHGAVAAPPGWTNRFTAFETSSTQRGRNAGPDECRTQVRARNF